MTRIVHFFYFNVIKQEGFSSVASRGESEHKTWVMMHFITNDIQTYDDIHEYLKSNSLKPKSNRFKWLKIVILPRNQTKIWMFYLFFTLRIRLKASVLSKTFGAELLPSLAPSIKVRDFLWWVAHWFVLVWFSFYALILEWVYPFSLLSYFGQVDKQHDIKCFLCRFSFSFFFSFLYLSLCVSFSDTWAHFFPPIVKCRAQFFFCVILFAIPLTTRRDSQSFIWRSPAILLYVIHFDYCDDCEKLMIHFCPWQWMECHFFSSQLQLLLNTTWYHFYSDR